jgi:hypothetical protein
MGLFQTATPAQHYARKLHAASWTDAAIAASIGASRSQITRIRGGRESGKKLEATLEQFASRAAHPAASRPAHSVQRPMASASRASPPSPHPARASCSTHTAEPQSGTIQQHVGRVGDPLYFAGDLLSWVGPDGQIVCEKPTARALPTAPSQDRREHETSPTAHAARTRSTEPSWRRDLLADVQGQLVGKPRYTPEEHDRALTAVLQRHKVGRTKGPRQAERRALETLFEDVRANARRELSAYGSYSEQQVDALAWERAHAVLTAQRHRPPALPAPLLRA